MENEIIQKQEDIFEGTPKEVRDFIISNLFFEKLEKITIGISLSSEQKSILSGTIVSLLVGTLSLIEAQEIIKNFSISEKNTQELFDHIDEEYITYAQELVIKYTNYRLTEQDIEEGALEPANAGEENMGLNLSSEIKTSPSDTSLPDIAPLEISAPASTPVFSLASKMAMPGVVAPIASVGQKFIPGPQAPIAPSAPRPAADPYREMPL